MSEGLMHYSAYAVSRNLPNATVYSAMREGRIPSVRGKIDPAIADETWLKAYQERKSAETQAADSMQRREQALIQTMLAKVQMTRKQTEKLRRRLVERDEAQSRMGGIVATLHELLPQMTEGASAEDEPLLVRAAQMIAADLGDIDAEVLKVTAD